MESSFLFNKILTLPKDLQEELENFVDYLKKKSDRKKKQKPSFGSGKGLFSIKHDFDESVDDFSDYMK